MSLKSIDTQLSLSRTKDVGAIQNQMNHKPSDDQVSLAAQAQKKMEDERKKMSQVSKTSEMSIKDQQSQNQKGQAGSHDTKNNHKIEDESHSSDHPYKGHRIDISL
ncbi:MAG: hypothetical protein WD424_03780 [Paenibacillaceae bacterium]